MMHTNHRYSSNIETHIIVSDDSLSIAPCAACNWTAGGSYSLTCSLVHMLHKSATFMWNGSHSDPGSVLNFGNLQFSQSGTYTCRVNISGVIIMKSATIKVHRKYSQL